jgi:hypothetical protein
MHCGLYRLLVNNGRVFGFMALFSCITLLMLLFWSTIARLRWSKNHCYLHTSNGRVLVKLIYRINHMA